MKKYCAISAVAMCMFLFSKAFASSDGLFTDLGIAASGDTAYYSEYLWRGMLLDGDPVVQTGLYVAGPATPLGKVTGKFWTSKDMENRDSRASDEFDYIVDYTYDLDMISISFGHTYYDFPDQTGADGAPKTFSREFYAGITLPKVFLAPSIFLYRDYGTQEDGGGMGTYTVINVAKSLPLEAGGLAMSVELAGHYGYNHELFINGKGGDIGMSAGLKIPLTKSLSIMPNINYMIPVGDVTSSDDGDQNDRFYTGVIAAYSF
ncbi:MAG TPA: hypothetical protein PLP56_01480 [Candidatus Omnitrophota bacterium]|nr:hypothetical protein [Candidatus Omnitrophota bacterium]HNQ50972.1 hypothetical protein [Candidatus Omnitrophota bacterium]HQO37806.1 hypothetical protein [Candidatus Omnitrophota bacterium]HQQ05637.1 hypothetical protein [Candidatus Omnitrophota bacterium]